MPDLSALTVDREASLLLLIDIQEKLAPAIADHDSIIRSSAILLQAAAILNVPVLVTEQYPKGLGPTVPTLREALEQAPSALGVIEKMAFSACTPEVLSAIEATGRRKIVIAGMETHVCVFQTSRDLKAAGYEVFLAADAVGSRTHANRESGLALIRACGAVITNVETLLFDWLKVAGTPEFKQISKLIK
jgi:nicotinamidase-related amidase